MLSSQEIMQQVILTKKEVLLNPQKTEVLL
jgi:hypothetical protein